MQGYHSGGNEKFSLLGCNVVEIQLTIWRNGPFPSSEPNNKPGKKPGEVNSRISLAYSSILKMDAMSLLTTRCYNPQHSNLQAIISN
jgi:hypothetical protein